MSRIANRPLTKPSEPHRFAELAGVLAAIVLLMLPAFLYASQRAKHHHAQQQIERLEAELAQLDEERQMLRIQLASELDPRRLHEKAREIADLREPAGDQVSYLPRRGLTKPRSSRVAHSPDALDGHP